MPVNSKPDAREIIRNVLQGEVDEFEKLIALYELQVFRIVGRMVDGDYVSEVSHEVFVKAYECLSGYRQEAPFEHWLSRIAVRTCYDHWRARRKREKRIFFAADETLIQPSLEVYRHRNEQDELKRWVGRALAHLGPEERLIFHLFYVEEEPLQQIAQILGWSISAVKSRAFRLRKKIKNLLEKELI